MVKILGSVSGTVAKSGRNTHQGYDYVMEIDLLEAVRKQLVEHKVFVFSSVEDITHEGKLTTVRTKHTFVDSESGETFEVFSAGQGSDGQDKGVYKAITGASKYFLLKAFMMAGDTDPEKASEQRPAKKPYNKPAKKVGTPAAGPKSSFKKSGGFGKKVESVTKATVSFNKAAEVAQEAKADSAAPLEDIPF